MKVTKRPVMILIILTLMGTLVPLLQLSASDSYLQENSDSALLERKFLKLYDEDAEFKEAVNEIRSMFDGDEFTDAQWLKYKELFNKVLDKLELPTLDELDEKELALFRKEVERDAAGWGLLDLESQDKGEKDIRLSDAEEIEIAEALLATPPFALANVITFILKTLLIPNIASWESNTVSNTSETSSSVSFIFISFAVSNTSSFCQ